MAGGWIDQPFVSSLNPEPPGSMVVVSLLPTVRYMDRCGMATGTRTAAQALWGDAFPAGRTPASLVRELYAVENANLAEPSGLAGHVRPHLPGDQPARLRRDRRRRLVPGARGVHVGPRGRRVAGAGDPSRPGHAAAAGLRSAGHQAPGPRLDRPAGRQRAGLLRRDRGDGPARPRRVAQRVLAGVGRDPAPGLRAPDDHGGPPGAAGGLRGRVPGRDALRLRRRLRDRRLRDAAAGLLAHRGARA